MQLAIHSYGKYIIKGLVGPTLFVTLSLTGILWLSQSLRFIELIVNRGLPLSKFVYLTSLLIPTLMGLLLPAALFIAVIYFYNRLFAESELVVLKGAGLSHLQIAKPALVFAALVTITGYIISLYVLPTTYREFKDMQSVIRDNYAAILLQEGVFNTPIDGLTVYIGSVAPNGVLKSIFVHDNRNTKNPSTMIAQEGRLIKTESGPRFELVNGNRQEIDKEHDRLTMLYFESYNLNLTMFEESTDARKREPQELYLPDLLKDDPSLKPEERNKLRAEAHQRLTWPLLSIALTFIACSYLIGGEFNRRGLWKKITTACVVSIAPVAIAIFLLNLVNKEPYLAPLMYLNIACFTAFGFYNLIRNDTWKNFPPLRPRIA